MHSIHDCMYFYKQYTHAVKLSATDSSSRVTALIEFLLYVYCLLVHTQDTDTCLYCLRATLVGLSIIKHNVMYVYTYSTYGLM